MEIPHLEGFTVHSLKLLGEPASILNLASFTTREITYTWMLSQGRVKTPRDHK